MNNRRDFIRKAGLLAAATATTSLLSKDAFALPPVAPDVIKPKALKAGDTIAMVAPAGAIFKSSYIGKFEATLKRMGFHVRHGKSLTAKRGYLAGSDAERAKEINDYFADPEVHGIIAMRGGWGCARMLDLIDYEVIARNPKVIMGFSDITSLLIAIYAKTGVITYHGPVGYSTWNDFSVRYVRKVLMQNRENVTMYNPADNKGLYALTPGVAEGELVGGNLTVLAGIVGSSYLPDWKGKILFLEETREEAYRVDRMLTTLKLAGILDQLSGFVFGKCLHCEPEVASESLSLREVLEDHLKPLGIPAVYGAMIGHISNKFTLPIGIRARLDAQAGAIELLEPAVS